MINMYRFLLNILGLSTFLITSTEDFGAIYIGPKTGDEKSVPLVVWPHGGPHSAFGSNLFLEGAMFLSLGTNNLTTYDRIL